jgi:hypothetical protein
VVVQRSTRLWLSKSKVHVSKAIHYIHEKEKKDGSAALKKPRKVQGHALAPGHQCGQNAVRIDCVKEKEIASASVLDPLFGQLRQPSLAFGGPKVYLPKFASNGNMFQQNDVPELQMTSPHKHATATPVTHGLIMTGWGFMSHGRRKVHSRTGYTGNRCCRSSHPHFHSQGMQQNPPYQRIVRAMTVAAVRLSTSPNNR